MRQNCLNEEKMSDYLRNKLLRKNYLQWRSNARNNLQLRALDRSRQRRLHLKAFVSLQKHRDLKKFARHKANIIDEFYLRKRQRHVLRSWLTACRAADAQEQRRKFFCLWRQAYAASQEDRVQQARQYYCDRLQSKFFGRLVRVTNQSQLEKVARAFWVQTLFNRWTDF